MILLIAGLTGLASAGQTLLILMGGFDLGVAGFIVAGAVSVTALQGAYHIPFLVAMAAAVAGSAVLGAIAGNVCHRYRIQPLIVTLAMGTIAVGLVEVQNGGTATGSAQPWLAAVTEPISKTFGVGLPPIIVDLDRRRDHLRRLPATDRDRPPPVRYRRQRTRGGVRARPHAQGVDAHVRVQRGAAALVGVLICGYRGRRHDARSATPTCSGAWSSVIVGGTIFGGPGNYTRTCVGALFVTVLTEVLIGHGASAATTQIVQGAIILLAITAYGRQRRLRDRL